MVHMVYSFRMIVIVARQFVTEGAWSLSFVNAGNNALLRTSVF